MDIHLVQPQVFSCLGRSAAAASVWGEEVKARSIIWVQIIVFARKYTFLAQVSTG